MGNGAQYAKIITATSASQSVSFVVAGATDIPLRAARIYARNGGSSSDVYFNFTTTSGASTGDFPLAAGKDITITAIDGGFYSGLSCIAAATTSSSVRCDILAYR